MKLKKGMQIFLIILNGSSVVAHVRDKDNKTSEFQLSRTQRNIFSKHGTRLRKYVPLMKRIDAYELLDDIEKEFCRADVLSNDFEFRYVAKDHSFESLKFEIE